MRGKSLQHAVELAISLAVSFSALNWAPVGAQCGFNPNDVEADCGPGERERKQKQQAIPPTATHTGTPTPSPTATYTPSPTATFTPVPALAPLPQDETPANSANAGGWLPPAVPGFILLVGVGLLGYRLYRFINRSGGGEGRANFHDLDFSGAPSYAPHPRKNSSRTASKDSDETDDEPDTLDLDGSLEGPGYGSNVAELDPSLDLVRPFELHKDGVTASLTGNPADSMLDQVQQGLPAGPAVDADLSGGEESALHLAGDPGDGDYESGDGLDVDAALDVTAPFEYHKDEVQATLDSDATSTTPAGSEPPGVGTRYTMFREDGTPLRPTSNFELTEADDLSMPRKTAARQADSADEGDADSGDSDDPSTKEEDS